MLQESFLALILFTTVFNSLVYLISILFRDNYTNHSKPFLLLLLTTLNITIINCLYFEFIDNVSNDLFFLYNINSILGPSFLCYTNFCFVKKPVKKIYLFYIPTLLYLGIKFIYLTYFYHIIFFDFFYFDIVTQIHSVLCCIISLIFLFKKEKDIFINKYIIFSFTFIAIGFILINIHAVYLNFAISILKNKICRCNNVFIIFQSFFILIIITFNLIHPINYIKISNKYKSKNDGSKQISISSDIENKLKLINKAIDEKVYLNHNLKLKDLSHITKINSNELSYLINEFYKANFNNFINSKRVEEAKKLLLNTDIKIIEIAYLSGFNSKTTFNVTFKKFEDMSPVQYRNKITQIRVKL
jgi:AraC-like DNA-binding protein